MSSCLLLECEQHAVVQAFVACTRHQLFALPGLPNPFRLPEATSARAALVSQDFYYRRLIDRGVDPASFFDNLRRGVNTVIFYDSGDRFGLAFEPSALDNADQILKFNGVYRDRDRYRHPVGVLYPDDIVLARRRAVVWQYTPAHLDKIRPTYSFLLTLVPGVRNRLRRLRRGAVASALFSVAEAGWQQALRQASRRVRPTLDVHHVAALSHISRYRLALSLHSAGMSGLNRISSIPSSIYGLDFHSVQFPWIGTVPAALVDHYRKELASRRLISDQRMSRRAFLWSMLQHRYVLAPSGAGELSYRMAEAWQTRRAVVCPDLGDAEVLYPLANGDNVIYFRPDLADVPELLEKIRRDEFDWEHIGTRGYERWDAWCANWPALFQHSFDDVVAGSVLSPTPASG